MVKRLGEGWGREEGTCRGGQRGEEGAGSEKSHMEINLFIVQVLEELPQLMFQLPLGEAAS